MHWINPQAISLFRRWFAILARPTGVGHHSSNSKRTAVVQEAANRQSWPRFCSELEILVMKLPCWRSEGLAEGGTSWNGDRTRSPVASRHIERSNKVGLSVTSQQASMCALSLVKASDLALTFKASPGWLCRAKRRLGATSYLEGPFYSIHYRNTHTRMCRRSPLGFYRNTCCS